MNPQWIFDADLEKKWLRFKNNLKKKKKLLYNNTPGGPPPVRKNEQKIDNLVFIPTSSSVTLSGIEQWYNSSSLDGIKRHTSSLFIGKYYVRC